MNEIIQLLENWKNLPTANPVFEKDYSIEGEQVRMTISTSVERAFLFKSFIAICRPEQQEIEEAIDKLDEKKDELI